MPAIRSPRLRSVIVLGLLENLNHSIRLLHSFLEIGILKSSPSAVEVNGQVE